MENRLRWQRPTTLVLDNWNNRDDATRDGAYAVVLAAVEHHLGLIARRRAEGLTGADYDVAPMVADTPDSGSDLDLEEQWLRLEVSGIDNCRTLAMLRHRVAQKEQQARSGLSTLPAMVGGVGFSMPRIALRHVD